MRRIVFTLIVIALLLTIDSTNAAAVVGPNPFTLAIENPLVGTVAWSNPSNAAICDAISAEATLPAENSLTHWLRATNASLSIPPTATVAGIELQLIAQSADNGHPWSTIAYLQLTKNDTVAGNSRLIYLQPGVGKTYTLGNPTDLWGTGWIPEDLNNLGALLSVRAFYPDTVDIDCLSVLVYYFPYKLNFPLMRR